MTMSADDVLKLSLAAAALIGGASVAYHYAVYIPARDDEANARQLAKANEALEQKASEEKRQKEKTASYRICLSNAQASYSARWDASCKELASEAVERRSRCIDSGVNPEWCEQQHTIPPASNCSLSGNLADSYDQALQRARQQCLDEAKTGVARFEQ